MRKNHESHRAALEGQNEQLRAALKPFADAVFNDNGDLTVSTSTNRDHYIRAYMVLRAIEQTVKR
jgi:hypothetical protein